MDKGRLSTITVLGSTQTLAWASSYYLPAVLADPIARDTGISTNWLFGIFSGALIISALLGPRMGRMIDAGGGNPVFWPARISCCARAGLCCWPVADSVPMLVAAWLALGIAMGFRPV